MMCEDYKTDKQENEENSVIELGDGTEGFEKAFEILRRISKTMRNINPVLERTF